MMLFEVMKMIEEIEPGILKKVMNKVSKIDNLLAEKRNQLAICESFQKKEIEEEYQKLFEQLEKWLEIENVMVDNVHPF